MPTSRSVTGQQNHDAMHGLKPALGFTSVVKNAFITITNGHVNKFMMASSTMEE